MIDPSVTPPPRLPEFVVVGAPKGGTTSIQMYLAEHPEIHVPQKGPRFFGDGESGNFHLGIDWYRELFRTDRPVCGEVSANYSTYPTNVVAQRMYSHIPSARLIYLVREPWSRVISHHLMHRRNPNRENLSFAEDLIHNPKLRHATRYGMQMSFLRTFYPAEKIMTVESSTLANETHDALRSIFTFLGVDVGFTSPKFDHKFNTSSQREENLRRYLSKRGGPVADTFGTIAPVPTTGTTNTNENTSTERVLIPASLVRELHEEFRREVDELRQWTGLSLPSLEVPPLPDLLAAHS